jgi:hypothetical protein
VKNWFQSLLSNSVPLHPGWQLGGSALASSVIVVEYGQLEMLQWLRVHEGVWDERICEYAVEFGNAEVLQWAKDNSCPGADDY